MSGRLPGPEEPAGLVLPRVRRDRHGRGMRGPLAPSDSPLSTSRAQRFDEMVIAAVERLDTRWQDQLNKVEFAVEDVPSLDDWEHDWVPLARAFAGSGALPARVVVFRRPIETRALGQTRLRALVSDVVTEQVAELFGVDPEEIDPAYGGRDHGS
ncbi:metallopeptidase family protein [Haloactinopolyspora sp.]|uniref:metallopeptidase family protein n=1 Tax=Haloactinopolyspora sp. TaxID=1966353 RepID=UPI00260514DA|nr:metallopeptidase family protein [Haloactinopolyspora sp.]